MRYHIVGIAGAGMSAIANLLLDQGHQVSGSDLAANRLTSGLSSRGATIYPGHSPDYVRGAEVVLATAAVRAEHPELAMARELEIPIRSRGDLWREWSEQRPVVAIAGTHGKTTTSALTTIALHGAGLNPGFLIGAEVPDLGTNAAWGDPAAPLVIEADEYDRVFLALRPAVAVITNVEWDHPDIYPSAEEYHAAFAQFAASLANPGRLVVCGDDPAALALGGPATTTYGIDETLANNPASCRLAPLDWTATGVAATPQGQRFEIWRYDRRRFGTRLAGSQALRLAGLHNVRNALAALAVAELLGADLTRASQSLTTFTGTRRRFELKADGAGLTLIDDYAHHPTEVRATLAAARQRYPGRRIVAYLQPHTFSRTAALLDDWAGACDDADLLLVGDIYAAREHGDPQTLARALARRIAAHGVNARYVGDLDQAAAALIAAAQPGDVVLTLGAGDGDRVGEKLIDMTSQKSEVSSQK